MSGRVGNLTPEEAARTGQPILLYNASYKQWLFVSNDKDTIDNVVESHPYKNETRNQFVLKQVKKNVYKIYNPDYRQWLFVSNSKDGSDHMVLSHVYEDEKRNLFSFEKVDDGKYLIFNPSYDEYVFVSNSKLRGDNLVLSHPPCCRHEERNKFSLELLHDAKVESVSFDIDSQKTTHTKPKSITSVTIKNDSSIEQMTTFSVNESISETSHFDHTFGISLTVGTQFKVGIPFISEGKVDLSVTSDYNHNWGTATTIQNDFKMDFPLKAPPKTKVEANAIVHETQLEVPYKMTLSTGDGNYLYSHGIWKRLSHWNLRMNISESPL